MNPHRGHGILARIARILARAAVPRALWPIVDDEIQEELSEREGLGWSRWRSDVWVAAQYFTVAARLAVERMIPNPGYRRSTNASAHGGWSLDLKQARHVFRSRRLVSLTPDARLALRMLVKSPLLSVVGGLGMAVAIAVAAGFFAFMTFYYSDVPVEDGDRVVGVDYVDGSDNRSTLFDYQLWKDEVESIEDLAAYRTVSRDLEGPISGSGPVEVAEMTASGFRVAKIPPLLGRPLLDSDEIAGATPVVVIGYREWHRLFDADPTVIGRDVRLNGVVHTVVGVMPEGFRFPVNHGYWTALETGTPLYGPVTARAPRLRVFGRLTPGVEAAAVEAEAAPIGERILAEYPQIYERRQVAVEPYVRHALGLDRAPPWAIWLLQLFGALILIAVAVNVGVLFYARTALRRVEITVRTALGASRSRIVIQSFSRPSRFVPWPRRSAF